MFKETILENVESIVLKHNSRLAASFYPMPFTPPPGPDHGLRQPDPDLPRPRLGRGRHLLLRRRLLDLQRRRRRRQPQRRLGRRPRQVRPPLLGPVRGVCARCGAGGRGGGERQEGGDEEMEEEEVGCDGGKQQQQRREGGVDESCQARYCKSVLSMVSVLEHFMGSFIPLQLLRKFFVW